MTGVAKPRRDVPVVGRRLSRHAGHDPIATQSKKDR
jgi:hypothetical protein